MSDNNLEINGKICTTQKIYETVKEKNYTEQNLKKMDKNSDGKISEDELVSFSDAKTTESASNTQSSASAAQSGGNLSPVDILRLQYLNKQKQLEGYYEKLSIAANSYSSMAHSSSSSSSRGSSGSSSQNSTLQQVLNTINNINSNIAQCIQDMDNIVANMINVSSQQNASKIGSLYSSGASSAYDGSLGSAKDANASKVINSRLKGALSGKGDAVVAAAEKYNIDPYMLAAIVGLESGWGTSNYATQNYNFGGVTGKGDAGYTVRSSDGFKFAKYSSPEAGLDAMAKNLSTYDERFSDVKAVDMNNIDAIAIHYCDASWAGQVKNIYNGLKKSA